MLLAIVYKVMEVSINQSPFLRLCPPPPPPPQIPSFFPKEPNLQKKKKKKLLTKPKW